MNLFSISLRKKIESDPYYRFQTLEEIKVAAEMGIGIDVNRATVDDWLRLPGISIRQARALVELVDAGIQLLCVEDIAVAIGISLQRVKYWEPILAFCYYEPESSSHLKRVDLNSSSLEDILEIPSIEPALAEAIVRDRASGGKFRNLIDFRRRLALNGELTSQLMHYLRF